MHLGHNPAHILHNDVRSDASSERRFLGRDIRRLVKIVHAAILNPCECMADTFRYSVIHGVDAVYVPWDVEDYYAECVKPRWEEREMNKHRFPCPSLGSYNCPLTIVDIRGRIALWYLPGLLSARQQVSRKKSNRIPDANQPHSLHCDMEP